MKNFIKIVLLIELICGFSSIHAQSFVRGEYYIDTDPGVGNGISIGVSSLSDTLDLNLFIPSTGLAEGSHLLYMRFKDTADQWNLIASQTFNIFDNSNSVSAHLVGGEYFIDSDPGIGNGIPLANFSSSDSIELNFSINSTGMSIGTHQLFCRFFDSNENWTQVEERIFIIADSSNNQSASLVGGEYFIDTDPGIGNGIALANFTSSDSLDISFNINSAGLSVGAHQLFYRFYDSNGNWSQLEERMFNIADSTNTQSATFVSGEYFIDTDPGVGNAISIPSISASDSLDITLNEHYSNLEQGSHQLFYRFLDTDGNWSQVEGRIFNIVDTTNSLSADIVKGEYFFDTDPGVGNGALFSNFNSADSLNLSLSVNTANLSLGSHQLFYRFCDLNGNWSLIDSRTINITDSSNNQSPILAGGEYFFDTDLGVGNGTPIPNFSPADSIDINLIALSSGLSLGKHYLFSRFYDSNGNWSQLAVDSIEIVSCFTPTARFYVSDVCFGDSIVFLDSSLSTDISTSYHWDLNNNQAIVDTTNGSFTYAPLAAGSYYTKLVVDNGIGCKDSLIKTFTVFALPIVNLGVDTNICQNDSLSLAINGFTSYLWDNNSVDSNRVLTTSGVYWLEVTDSNQCTSTDSISLSILALPTVNLTGLASSYCDNENPVTLLGLPYGGTFTGNGIVDSVFYPDIADLGNQQIVYQYTDTNMCINSDSLQTIIFESPKVSFSGLATSYCSNGESSFLVPNIVGGVFQGNGINANTFDPSSAQVGQNQIQYSYTDNHACSDSTTHITTVYQTPDISAFTATPTSFTSTPFISQFSPNVNNPIDYTWNWNFGDGTNSTDSTPTHQYNNNGDYTVSLAAQSIVTGCSDTIVKTNFISCSGASPCNLGAKIWMDTLNTVSICPGDSFLLNAGSYNASYIYMWLRNGVLIPNANSINFYAKQMAYYQLIISNGNCIDVSAPFLLNHYTTIEPVIQQIGTFAPCANDSVKLEATTAFSNYLWSTGETSSEIYVKQSGYYTLSVVDAHACLATSQAIIINASSLPIPEICRLSVDSISGFNTISWNANQLLDIDSVKIYREGYINNQFELLSSLSSSANPSFTDINSQTKVRSYRYRISMVDTCGVETPMSNYHRSIHFMISAGLNGKWNLLWSHYAGRPVATYQIYRGLDSTNMQLLAQLSSSNRMYTDLSAPSGNVYYQIKAVFSDTCYYTTALSNLLSTSKASGIGFENIAMQKSEIRVFPNPNNGRFTLNFKAVTEGISELELFDIMGKRLYYKQLFIVNGMNQDIDMRTLAKGMYFIRISQEGRILAKKVVVVQ